MAANTYNTIVLLPFIPKGQSCDHYGAGPVRADAMRAKTWQDRLLPWSGELQGFGEEGCKHAAVYAPPSYSPPKPAVTAKCYPVPIFPMLSVDRDDLLSQFPGVEEVERMHQEWCRHTLAVAREKINLKDFKIIIPGHGSPIGIGAGESGPTRIPPETFADSVFHLVSRNVEISRINSLAFRFLSCNSGTPFAGTDFIAHEPQPPQPPQAPQAAPAAVSLKKGESAKRKLQGHVTKKPGAQGTKAHSGEGEMEIERIRNYFRSSFAGRFAQQLINDFNDNDYKELLKPIRISVSGIVGFYQHFTSDNVQVLASHDGKGEHTSFQNALVTFTKEVGMSYINVELPKTLLHIAPSWLFPKDVWEQYETVMPEPLSRLRTHQISTFLTGVVPPEQEEIWQLVQSPKTIEDK